jgi:2,5-dioxopentanoate dehydrogenase
MGYFYATSIIRKNNMVISGKNFVGNTLSAKGSITFSTVNPVTAQVLPENFYLVTAEEIEAITAKAATAFTGYQQKLAEEKAVFLETIADEIMVLGDELINRAAAETGLPLARLTVERGRTTGQLKMFANALREGSWVQAKIDTAIPGRQPLPKPDLRSMLVPLGPVLVFGASNFPFAYSAAGGDTAAAMAAGCPVIVKAHPSHAGTDALVAHAIITAAQKTNMPDGIFSMFFGAEEMAMQMVTHPVVKAIGFTGSRKGGMAIYNAAVNRPQPIPVYAEMSAVNPVLLMPGAIAANPEVIAQGLAASVTMGVGQFCTNPGLVFMIDDDNAKIFLQYLAANIEKVAPATMLSTNICKAYAEGIKKLKKTANVLAQGSIAADGGKTEAAPYIFTVVQKDFIANKNLSNEVFGPTSLIVLCKTVDEIKELLQHADGQLTATIHANINDENYLPSIINLMQEKAGRVLFGGFPTGVEVCDAMVHGGPFPATTDARSTSVGSSAMLRFARPVAYQNFPQQFLPHALKDNNPSGILRMINGQWTREAIHQSL